MYIPIIGLKPLCSALISFRQTCTTLHSEPLCRWTSLARPRLQTVNLITAERLWAYLAGTVAPACSEMEMRSENVSADE